MTLGDGGGYPCGGPHARHQISDGHADPRRLTVGEATDAHEARHSLGNLIESGPLAVRTLGTESGNRSVNEPRIIIAQSFVMDTHGTGGARFKIFHQHIGSRCQCSQKLQSFFAAEIHREAALVAVDAEIKDTDTFVKGTPATHHFAAGKRLHLGDVGAEITEDHGAEGPGQGAGQIQNADGLQGQRHGGTLGISGPRIQLSPGVWRRPWLTA